MKNEYAAKCSKCGFVVAPGDGDMRRVQGRFRVIHFECPEPVMEPGHFATHDRQLPTDLSLLEFRA